MVKLTKSCSKEAEMKLKEVSMEELVRFIKEQEGEFFVRVKEKPKQIKQKIK